MKCNDFWKKFEESGLNPKLENEDYNQTDAVIIDRCIYHYGGTVTQALIEALNNLIGSVRIIKPLNSYHNPLIK